MIIIENNKVIKPLHQIVTGLEIHCKKKYFTGIHNKLSNKKLYLKKWIKIEI